MIFKISQRQGDGTLGKGYSQLTIAIEVYRQAGTPDLAPISL